MMAKRLMISNSQPHICALLSCAIKLGEGAKQRRGLPWSWSRRVEELWHLQLRNMLRAWLPAQKLLMMLCGNTPACWSHHGDLCHCYRVASESNPQAQTGLAGQTWLREFFFFKKLLQYLEIGRITQVSAFCL